MSIEVSPEPVLQLGLAFWGSKVLLSAVELGLFTELAQQPLDRQVLAERLGLHERGAEDFLDALVALGVLERDGSHYRNAPAADAFLDRGKPDYVGGLLEMANRRLYPFWGDLTEGLRTGRPQNESKHGGSFFDVLYDDPDRLRQFLQAMTGISLGAARAIATQFPWEQHGTVADIGCAAGALPVQVLQRHPHLTGIGFDLPPVRPVFEEHVADAGLTERLQFHAGDFFVDPLPRADVVVLGHILHDWSVEQRLELLNKAFRALPPGGAVVVYDAVIDDDRRSNAFGLLMSLNMLIETDAGSDYTGAECMSWMRKVGFSDAYVQPLVGPDSMVVGHKT
jgi:SAM-dependent methyltransferase